jgi:D-glycero-alpha-D-manno-heptose-7-phosphate kinase
LGGSSSFCVGLLYLINQLYKHTSDKKTLVLDAIKIEREILQETGGIQDHIWPVYGGLNSIEIHQDGNFFVKPLPITEDFYKEIEKSVVLIYTNEQRIQEEIAKSHESKDKTRILDISHKAYEFFIKEDIKSIGELLYESWKEKRGLSSLISNTKIDQTVSTVIEKGAYGAKLLGAGGCGFVLAICNPKVKEILTDIFKDSILSIQFESDGVSKIYS